jgi:hypothetical protein
VDVFKADLCVGRNTSTSPVAPTPPIPPIPTAGSTKGMSRKSRRRMVLVVRNVEGFTHFATLNYSCITPNARRPFSGSRELGNRFEVDHTRRVNVLGGS